jgi:hypothetical protein
MLVVRYAIDESFYYVVEKERAVDEKSIGFLR